MEENLAPNQGAAVEEAPLKGAVPIDFNSQADAFLDSVEKGTPEGSAPLKDPTASPEVKDAGADQLKKASPEDVGKDEAGKDPRDLMFRKGYNEAKAKFEKDFEGINREEIENFKKLTSSPDYIRASMKTQGYTDEAIDRELTKRGFDVQSKEQDDLGLVTKALGIKTESLDENTRAVISDVAKIADIIMKDRMSKILPDALKPITEQTTKLAQKEGATQFMNTVKSTLASEGVLDYKQDIEPVLNKFLDDNPEATQDEVLNYFNQVNHSMTIERLKSGKKQVERKEVLKGNRPLSKEAMGSEIKLPKKTGDFTKDADSLLDAFNVQ
mgnify:CR=1 FL=1